LAPLRAAPPKAAESFPVISNVPPTAAFVFALKVANEFVSSTDIAVSVDAPVEYVGVPKSSLKPVVAAEAEAMILIVHTAFSPDTIYAVPSESEGLSSPSQVITEWIVGVPITSNPFAAS